MGIEEDVSRHLKSRAKRIDPGAGSPIRLAQRPSRRGWVAAAIAAVVVLVIGVVGILVGSRGSGEPEERAPAASAASAATTTTSATATTAASEPVPTVAPVADGPPLEFSRVDTSLPVSWIQEVIHRDGVVYAVGGVFSENSADNRTELWSSPDGVDWSRLSTITEGPTHVSALASGPGGFVAVGTRWEEPDPDERSFFGPAPSSEALVWTSPDGRIWTEQALPTPFENSILPVSIYSGWAAMGDTGAVVLGSVEPNIEQLVFASLPEDVLAVLEESGGYGFSMGGSPFQFTVDGPGGTTLWRGGPEDLGWDAETTAAVESMFSGTGGESRTILWHSADLVNWTRLESHPFESNTYIHELASLSDGNMLAVGGGEAGPSAWTSADGLTWDQIDSGLDINSVDIWGDRTLALAFLGNDMAIVELTDDGWVATSPEDPFGGPETWHIQSLSAGDGGVAAVAMGYNEAEMMGPAPATVTGDNGRTVTMDEMEGFITVRDGDEVLLELAMWETSVENPVVDVEAGTLTYLDPDTGDPLVTIGITDLEDAQQAAYAQADGGPMKERTAVLSSPDGETWSITYLDDQFDQPGFVQQVILVGGRVVLLRQPIDESAITEPEPVEPLPLEVWVADL